MDKLQQIMKETKRLGGVFDTEKSKHQAGSVWDKDGLSPTLDTMQGVWRQPCIIDDNDTYVNKKYREFVDENGYVPDMFNPYHKTEVKEIAPTQTTYCGSTTSSATVLVNTNAIKDEQKSLRIRKLTPRECFRLMGFDDSDFDKVEGNLSDTQLYKQAGNSIVVNVLEEIYKELFKSIKL